MAVTDFEINQALKKVGQILKKLDRKQKKIDQMKEKTSIISLKKWLTEKEAIAEIKKVMLGIGQYENYYDDSELNDFEKYMKRIVESIKDSD